MPNPSSPISPHHPGNPMRRHSLPVIVVVFALLAFVWSCDQPAGPGEVDQKPMFSCLLIAEDSLYDDATNKKEYKPNIFFYSGVQSSPIAEKLEIKLNGRTANSVGTPHAFYAFFWQKILTGFIFMPSSGSIACEMNSSVGNSSGIIIFPSPVIITSHKDYDSAYADQPLSITWTGDAQNYFLRFRFSDTRACGKISSQFGGHKV